MSTFAEIRKFDYNYSGSILTEKDINDSFKYIRPNQLNNIVKEVERQRSKRDEEHLWTSVLQHQDLKFEKKTQEYATVSNYDLMKLELKSLDENTHSFGSKTKRINKKHEEPFEIKEQAFTKRQIESLNSTQRSNSSNSSSGTFIVTQDNNNFDDSPNENSYISSATLNDNFNYQKNKNYCNSSPDLNLQYEKIVSKERKVYEISLHPNVKKKVLIIQTKISELLNEISYRLGRIPRPDGESDLRRRQQRLAEFGIRFSRNYLYVLGRQVIDIQQHIKAAELSFNEKIKKNNFILHIQAIESKILSSHQLLMYALDAYAKHVSSSGIKGHPGKLGDILQVLVQLKEICNKINLSFEFLESENLDIYPLGDNIQTRCYEILSKVNSTSEINSPSAISYGAHSTHGFPGVSDRRKIDNHKIPNRLSMYNSVSNKKSYRDPKNRRHVGSHPKDKAQRTLSMPINNPPPTPNQSYQNSLIRKSQKIRKSRINGLLHEDKISTTMGLIPKFSETIVGSERLSRKLPSTAPSEIKIKKKPKCYKRSKLSLQSGETVLHDEKNEIKQEDLSNFVPVIADFVALLPKNKNNNNETDFWASFEDLQEQYKKPKNKITNSDDNAKLICINYEEEEEKTDDKNEDETKLIVDAKAAERILNYRDKFYQFCLTNPLYTSKTSNEPSEVVAWVSEKLKEELLVDLTKKLEMNEVIRRLYDLEFQEF